MTSDQIAAAHEAVIRLASMDSDGARVQNAVGYNKIDSRIGHSLAERESLTPAQAALARKVVAKYRRQLGDALIERMGP